MRPGYGIALSALLALAAAGCSSDKTVTARDLTAPAAPQALYSVTGDGRVTLHWVKNTELDLSGYRVYRAPAFVGPYDPLGLTTATTWVDDTVANGVTYWYAVSAYDRAGNESDLSVENVHDTPRPEGFDVSLVPTSLEASGTAGFDFSGPTQRLSADPRTDVYFTVLGGTLLMEARDLQTDIQDAGYHTMDELDWAPPNGWSPTGTAELILGHAYYVFTRDSHYAKFRVTALSSSLVRFDWAYQIDPGNPELKPRPVASARRAAVLP